MSFWSAALPILGGAAGGLFGGQPELPDELKRIYRMSMRLAREAEQEGKLPALSGTGEQNALAAARALAQRDAYGQQQQLYDVYGQMPGGSPNERNLGDALLGQHGLELAQSANIGSRMLDESLARHLALRFQTAPQILGVANQAASGPRITDTTGQDIAGMFGELGKSIGFREALARGRDPRGGLAAAGGQGNLGQPGPAPLAPAAPAGSPFRGTIDPSRLFQQGSPLFFG